MSSPELAKHCSTSQKKASKVKNLLTKANSLKLVVLGNATVGQLSESEVETRNIQKPNKGLQELL